MDQFKDELLDVPITFDQKSPERQKYEQSLIYQLSKQYATTAHEVVSEIKTELDLRQYYTLINQSIRCLRYLKDGRFQLSLEQDFQVSIDLAILLIEETYRYDLAEQYIQSLKERLQNTSWHNEKMYAEYLLLYKIPLIKDNSTHTKIALRNMGKLINSLDNSLWRVLFVYFRLQLMPDNEQKLSDYRDILKIVKNHTNFHFVVMCSLISYCLDLGISIPTDLWNEFLEINSALPKLNLWKLLLELLIIIYQDVNITDKLAEFKVFFESNKQALDEPLQAIHLFENISLKLDLPFFNYKDAKNLLLLFQSVSYLPNCYDKRSNFSIKFLPKVANTTKSLRDSLVKKCSLIRLKKWQKFYNKLLSLVDFYQACESVILKGIAPQTEIVSPYDQLLKAWAAQLSGNREQALAAFESIQKQDNSGVELRLIALLHVYSLTLSQISEEGTNSEKLSELTFKSNSILSELENLLSNSLFAESTVWRCTILLLVIMGRFEPFNKHPLNKSQATTLLTELEKYFSGNSLLPNESSSKGAVKIKKSLLLHIWLNYISGFMLVSELEDKCVISSTCFKLAKQQHLPYLQYLIGIWNLMNSTMAMKGKEVAITRAKLEQIVEQISPKNMLQEKPASN